MTSNKKYERPQSSSLNLTDRDLEIIRAFADERLVKLHAVFLHDIRAPLSSLTLKPRIILRHIEDNNLEAAKHKLHDLEDLVGILIRVIQSYSELSTELSRINTE